MDKITLIGGETYTIHGEHTHSIHAPLVFDAGDDASLQWAHDLATDGRDHEWGWYVDHVPALVAEIRHLRGDQRLDLYDAFFVLRDVLAARIRTPVERCADWLAKHLKH